MNLDAYSDAPSATKNSIRCDCGNRKTAGAEACRRCTFLDGVRGQARVVEALRCCALTLPEMCTLLGLNPDSHGSDSTSLQRTLSAMVKRGRVRRYWRDGNPIVVTRRLYGKHRITFDHVGGGAWVYVLSGEWRGQ